jgi:hypothetical protein
MGIRRSLKYCDENLVEKNLGAIKQVSKRFSVADTFESTRNDPEEPSFFGNIKCIFNTSKDYPGLFALHCHLFRHIAYSTVDPVSFWISCSISGLL